MMNLRKKLYCLLTAYNINQLIIFFNIPGGGNDWKLFYEAAHHNVVKAFQSLF